MKKLVCLFLSLFIIFSFTLPAAAVEPDTDQPPVQSGDVVSDCDLVVTFSDAPVSTSVDVIVAAADGSVLPEGAEIWYRTVLADAAPDNAAASQSDEPSGSQWVKYTGPVSVEANCVFSAKIIYADGSESDIFSVSISCIDKLPPTPPEIFADTATWVNDFVEVSLVSGTDLESGIARTEYRLGESVPWGEYTGPVRITAPTVIYARSIDNAGNASLFSSLAIENFDTTPPDVSGVKTAFASKIPPVQTDSGVFGRYYRSDVSVTVDGAHDSQSGVAMYQYQFCGSSDSLTDDGWKDYSPSSAPVITGDFCGYVYTRAIDNAGNVSLPAVSDGIVIDITAPVISNITPSITEITDKRVVVRFDVSDNFWLDSVMVNGTYVGTYSPSFNVFRNGDYTITAADKAGNTATAVFTVSNINSTPFSLLSVFNQLDKNSFTPSTWSKASAAADELQRLLTVETNSAMINAASEKLTAAMEGLVSRGDGTMSLALIERVSEYDSSKYTASSWALVEAKISDIRACLDNPESTQADVDAVRRSLEMAVSELVLLGNFTGLDRLISQCEAIGPGSYDPVKYEAFSTALEAAKALSRTDSAQADVDSAYSALLASMNALRIEPEEPEKKMPVLGYVIIGLLGVFILTVLFILFKERSQRSAALLDEDEAEEPEDPVFNVRPDIGDISFTDSDGDEDDPA